MAAGWLATEWGTVSQTQVDVAILGGGPGCYEAALVAAQLGARVAVVDDGLTTAGSVLQAIAAVEQIGAEVAAVICIVDRLEGARERLTPKYNFLPIFTIRDFGIEPLA